MVNPEKIDDIVERAMLAAAEFSGPINVGGILVNTPTSQGAVGGIFNNLTPSLKLGCGTGRKNITTENITAKRLLNIQRVCYEGE